MLELSEVQKLKARNYILESQILNLQVELANNNANTRQAQLMAQRVSLEGEFNLIDESKIFDWESLKLIDKPKDLKLVEKTGA